MTIAPQNNNALRPHTSIAHRPGTVQTTLTTLVMIVIVKGFEIPEFSKKVVP